MYNPRSHNQSGMAIKWIGAYLGACNAAERCFKLESGSFPRRSLVGQAPS
jgi:hypothetical protein